MEDIGNMDEYVKKLKASINQLNLLDGTAIAPSAGSPDPYAAYDPHLLPPDPPAPPPPSPAVRDTYKTSVDRHEPRDIREMLKTLNDYSGKFGLNLHYQPELSSEGTVSSSELHNHMVPEYLSMEQMMRRLNLEDLYPKRRRVPGAADAGSTVPTATTTSSSTDTHKLQTTTVGDSLSTSTEDVRASMNRFWDSSDSGTMDEYLKKLETSIDRFNVLDGSAYGRPAHRPRADPAGSRDPYAAYDPDHLLPDLPPRMPVRNIWSDDTHHTVYVSRQKHGVQAWHVVIFVLIALAAIFSYVCKLAAKRDRSGSERRDRSASSCTSTPATRRGRAAQAHDPTASTAPLRDPVRPPQLQRPPPLLPAEPDDVLHGVMVDRSELRILAAERDAEEETPPQRRAATPPPPYPGLPHYLHSNDGKCKEEEDPPPPYQAEIVKKPS